MSKVEDFQWKPERKVFGLVEDLGSSGFQGIELKKASDCFVKMKREGAKIYLTFTSNMATSGLRGFFAQLIKLGMANAVITTVGSVEEDIMKAIGEDFYIGRYYSDDVALHEKGTNRVGNLLIKNESYERFEAWIKSALEKLYQKKNRWPVVELLKEIGLMLKDENSILYQCSKNKVPIFCPAITDGAFGFHLFLFQQDHPDFMIDVVKDFADLIYISSHDDKKGIIALGGGVSKHHAILGTLLNGGAEYAVYMTTAHEHSGSLSGATTREAKSWGKIKDDADAVTVIGDVSVFFPMAMFAALDQLSKEGLLNG
ncbi:MAG: deoxyhypusine synthase [Candidatus Aenigmarchaeota archaeon CG_4_10_14_0_8_um_filter_37_24]|nr:deoxyhypusine synthase family protein [Candidatus Aenigmarchaeota archaeon]OIN88066.1 MAG: deoxyhypusine synthase [Candidatus Aenigmarchaeota archaeon CG1_02_38_14]PIV69040.1 MAG: deoxyhypusine synthase [Candidatus Aenigmarchaeota archaeon CG01_land_8_20_14_3_00_37_9]PIW41748.1 MAG: deoxyhypusine synthase [Candidatus Aenigmarchaeota archaeon CG15_BIG_FIL_POST_REV_8_21_14_020_37_27]PIX50576.1 MAG: deoxyhypusine synthase [Candidatus Aenigmarchaeota archaeon CG_4_8_14_3_um_filter_37_24]PIY3532